MPGQYLTLALDELLVGEPLPAPIYVCIDQRFIKFRAGDDVIDRDTYGRLELKKVKYLFIQEGDRPAFENWAQSALGESFEDLAAQIEGASAEPGGEATGLAAAREDAHRKAMDIFQSAHPEKAVAETIGASKKIVDEVMKFPYAVSSLAKLQTYSRGTVDHSVNVSVLSAYLALQMGYSHQLILQHITMGGLLHDVGKTQVDIKPDDDATVIDQKIRAHPEAGLQFIESQPKVPNEVKMIVAQHHECYDGSGFPKKMRGGNIYDLARIVSIANVFDELVGDGRGTLVERQKSAIKKLDSELAHRFDPQKLEKALKILKMGV
jgi:putative nucleotidyltransferase with HDIG domain